MDKCVCARDRHRSGGGRRDSVEGGVGGGGDGDDDNGGNCGYPGQGGVGTAVVVVVNARTAG